MRSQGLLNGWGDGRPIRDTLMLAVTQWFFLIAQSCSAGGGGIGEPSRVREGCLEELEALNLDLEREWG